MAKWGEIKCERCAEQDALWEGMERALEESDAREARLEAKLAKAVEALGAIYEITVEPAETDHKNVRGWIEVTARATLAELKGRDDE